jgi:hypothetical protein
VLQSLPAAAAAAADGVLLQAGWLAQLVTVLRGKVNCRAAAAAGTSHTSQVTNAAGVISSVTGAGASRACVFHDVQLLDGWLQQQLGQLQQQQQQQQQQ